MLKRLLEIFGGGNQDALKEALKQKTVRIIDVRTPGEFRGGSATGAVNIPLQELEKRMSEIKKMSQPIVLCCASGMRSASAKSVLKSQGVEAIDGGGWKNVAACQS